MSTNKTANYALHSWAGGDDFLRSEFNENFTKLDTALKGADDAIRAQLSAVNAAIRADFGAADTALNAALTAANSSIRSDLGAADAAILAELRGADAAINAVLNNLFVFGSYQGNGSTGATQDVYLGFKPRMLVVMPQNRDVLSGGTTFGGVFIGVGSSGQCVLTQSGFQVKNLNISFLNHSAYAYDYLALR